MNEHGSGVILIGGKIYNVSQINSVYTDTVPTHKPESIWTLFVFLGVICFPLIAFSWFIWIVLTVFSFWGFCHLAIQRKHALFLEMSSGKTEAFSDTDFAAVEKVKNEVLKKL